ncbi:MAG: translation initiation factor IF-2 [bacterium]|nr:MAG: translation initiation factor IF-2 [bacterium]
MIRNIFAKVLKDNLSGSGQVLFRVQQSLLQFVRTEGNPEPTVLLRQLEKLEQHFPHFALLFHFLDGLKTFVMKNPSAKGWQLEEFVRQYRNRWENTRQKASENLLRNLSLSGKNVLLHSNSSAIHNLFQIMADRKIFPTVWQTVSSPANEGLIQADFLKSMGFDIHVFHEDAASKFITNINLAIFGADLLWDDSFLNKVGTFPLALIFRHFHKPVYVLAESRKKIDTLAISEERLRHFLDEQPKPEKEIMDNPVPGLPIHNYYFEAVPMSLVDRVFVDK